jgi:hypothetical protein
LKNVPASRKSVSGFTVLLAFLAIVFYSTGSWWGAPHAVAPDRVQSWGVDDESPLGPLAEMHNILEPKENQWLSYPLMYSFVTATAYAPYMGYLIASGGMAEVSGAYPFGLTDPVNSLHVLTIIAHLVSVVMATLVVLSAYDIGRTLVSSRAGLFYALFVLFSFPLVYYARNGNVDAMALGFVALATAAFCRIVQDGLTLRGGIWLGIFSGFALATKESSVGVFLLMPLVMVYIHYRQGHDEVVADSPASFWKAAGAGLLAAVLAFGVGSGLFVDPDRYIAHVNYLRELLAMVSASSTANVNTFDYSLQGQIGYLLAMLARIVDAIGIPGILLLLAGIIFAIRHRSVALLPLLLAIVYFVYLLLSYRLAQVRYLMPVIFLLLFYAAYSVESALQSESTLLKAGMTVLGVAALGLSSLHAVDLTYQMVFDSRYEAADWLRNEAKAGDTIAYFGPASKLPHLEAGIELQQATDYQGMYSVPDTGDVKVREILSHWEVSKPGFVILMPDHTSAQSAPYSHTVPPRLFTGLKAGSMGYRQVAFFQTPSLFPWLDMPQLDYRTVNPSIHIFAPNAMERTGTDL